MEDANELLGTIYGKLTKKPKQQLTEEELEFLRLVTYYELIRIGEDS